MDECGRCGSDGVWTTQDDEQVWGDQRLPGGSTVCNNCGAVFFDEEGPKPERIAMSPQQLERVRDVDAWNVWRSENDGERVSLTGASLQRLDLERINLSMADLESADLRDADLSGANLSGANLKQADLSGANLTGANLSGANLSGANLGSAYLEHADLSGANLHEADLSYAKLGGADLRRTDLRETRLEGVYLSGANLSGTWLEGVDLGGRCLSGADLSGALLERANLIVADLSGADLTETRLHKANLSAADLSGASMVQAVLVEANLSRANLSGANLSGANLYGASLLGTELGGADLAGARVYGASVWDVTGTPAAQTDLIITEDGEAEATVDDLKVAQFIYLLLSNAEVRDVIDTVANKAVLILGRFTPERKAVLDSLRVALREKNYVPIMFDFEKPASRGYGETVKILAGMSRFVIADLTDSAEIRSELMQVAPNFPSLPIQPILLSGQPEYVTFETDVRPFDWVLDMVEYEAAEELVATVERIIEPAEEWLERAKRVPPPEQELLELREKVAALEKQMSTQQ